MPVYDDHLVTGNITGLICHKSLDHGKNTAPAYQYHEDAGSCRGMLPSPSCQVRKYCPMMEVHRPTNTINMALMGTSAIQTKGHPGVNAAKQAETMVSVDENMVRKINKRRPMAKSQVITLLEILLPQAPIRRHQHKQPVVPATKPAMVFLLRDCPRSQYIIMPGYPSTPTYTNIAAPNIKCLYLRAPSSIASRFFALSHMRFGDLNSQ